MALVTYILLSTLIAGLRGKFEPELLGYTATSGLAVVIVEIVALKLGCYLLSISSQSQLFDLIAYSGYKFVGIIVTVIVSETLNGGKGTGGWIGWLVFAYTFLANSLFLVCYPTPPAGTEMANILTADAIAEVCPAPRDVWPDGSPYADGLEGEAQPEDAVPLLLLVHCAAVLHVAAYPRVLILDTGQETMSTQKKEQRLKGFRSQGAFRVWPLFEHEKDRRVLWDTWGAVQ